MMDIEKLIKMANQIGDFYEAFPDQEEARKEIAEHINRFWSLVMRKSIAAHVREKQGAGLHERVKEAVQQYLQLS